MRTFSAHSVGESVDGWRSRSASARPSCAFAAPVEEASCRRRPSWRDPCHERLNFPGKRFLGRDSRVVAGRGLFATSLGKTPIRLRLFIRAWHPDSFESRAGYGRSPPPQS